MAAIVIYKRPTVSLHAESWEDLAARLRDLEHDVRREDRYMEPGRVGLIFGEFLVIYLGLKFIDVATDHAMEAVLERILDTVKGWGRERFGSRKDAARPRPLSIQIVDEDGNVLRTWRIDENGEQESDVENDERVTSNPAVNVHEEVPPAWEKVGDREAPQVLLLLRLTHEETHLRVDAFVEGQHRLVADLTRLPGRVAVSSTLGHVANFQIEETDGDGGFKVSAEGFRCEMVEVGDADLLVFCYSEE